MKSKSSLSIILTLASFGFSNGAFAVSSCESSLALNESYRQCIQDISSGRGSGKRVDTCRWESLEAFRSQCAHAQGSNAVYCTSPDCDQWIPGKHGAQIYSSNRWHLLSRTIDSSNHEVEFWYRKVLTLTHKDVGISVEKLTQVVTTASPEMNRGLTGSGPEAYCNSFDATLAGSPLALAEITMGFPFPGKIAGRGKNLFVHHEDAAGLSVLTKEEATDILKTSSSLFLPQGGSSVFVRETYVNNNILEEMLAWKYVYGKTSEKRLAVLEAKDLNKYQNAKMPQANALSKAVTLCSYRKQWSTKLFDSDIEAKAYIRSEQ